MTGNIVCVQNALGNDAPNACPAAPLRFATKTPGQTLTRTLRGNVCICESRCNVEKCVLPTAPLHFGSRTEIVDRTGCVLIQPLLGSAPAKPIVGPKACSAQLATHALHVLQPSKEWQ